jgi:WD repeat-containing protein 26
MEGHVVHNWSDTDFRVCDLALSPDGQRLVVISVENRIHVYDFATFEKLSDWPLQGSKVTSVRISKDSEHMLISFDDGRLELLHIDTGSLIQSYEGQPPNQFIIRSEFGGAEENFIVSGSERTFLSQA